jgi:hypothetical protein
MVYWLKGMGSNWTVHAGKEAMFIGYPVSETGEVGHDVLGIGVEDVGGCSGGRERRGRRVRRRRCRRYDGVDR